MISLDNARKEVMNICGEEFTNVYTTLNLREWSNENVISCLELKDGKENYPNIVVVEILTAVELKKKYKLEEIAEARKHLNLKCSLNEKLTSIDLENFMKFKKNFIEKRNIINKTFDKITSIKELDELADDLKYENKILQMISDYLDQFLKTKREVQK
jgi:hypothetical protein